jgi:hypothetical protein
MLPALGRCVSSAPRTPLPVHSPSTATLAAGTRRSVMPGGGVNAGALRAQPTGCRRLCRALKLPVVSGRRQAARSGSNSRAGVGTRCRQPCTKRRRGAAALTDGGQRCPPGTRLAPLRSACPRAARCATGVVGSHARGRRRAPPPPPTHARARARSQSTPRQPRWDAPARKRRSAHRPGSLPPSRRVTRQGAAQPGAPGTASCRDAGGAALSPVDSGLRQRGGRACACAGAGSGAALVCDAGADSPCRQRAGRMGRRGSGAQTKEALGWRHVGWGHCGRGSAARRCHVHPRHAPPPPRRGARQGGAARYVGSRLPGQRGHAMGLPGSRKQGRAGRAVSSADGTDAPRYGVWWGGRGNGPPGGDLVRDLYTLHM